MTFEDRTLRNHILRVHKEKIQSIASVVDDEDHDFDTYREALAVKERQGVPAVGPAEDRRAFDTSLAVYNDQSIHALICMCCGRICLQTAKPRSSIEYKTGKWLLGLPAGRSLANAEARIA